MICKIPFTPDQLSAINSNKSMVITACPGSGKTAVIVEKIRTEIVSLERYRGVVGISFTVKASKELSLKCKAGALDTKSSFFGTIDNFCLSEIVFPFISKLYRDKPLTITSIKYSELPDCYKERLPNLDKPEISFSTTDYAKYETEFISHYKDGFILLEAASIIACKIIESTFACRRYLQSRYSSIYVDEYQDTSEPQHSLFCAIHRLGLTAIAVGDIQQSIYAFRGGNPEHILALIQDPNFDHHIIGVNHRCHPSITNYANRLFSPKCELLATEQIYVFRRTYEGNQIDVAKSLGELIKRAAKTFSIDSFSEIAVLVKSNASIKRIQEHLTIPAKFYLDDPLSAINSPISKLISELLLYKFDNRRLVGTIFTDNDLQTITRETLKTVRGSITNLRTTDSEDIGRLLSEIVLAIYGYAPTARETQAITDILASPDILKQYGPREKNEIQVMTLHKSKGLEFEIVLHLDLYDWVFPYREYTGNFDEFIYPNWNQDLNLHYVAITRAKTACILLTSKKRLNSQDRSANATPSPFWNLPGLNGLFR